MREVIAALKYMENDGLFKIRVADSIDQCNETQRNKPLIIS